MVLKLYTVRRVPELSPFPVIEQCVFGEDLGYQLEDVVEFVDGRSDERFRMRVVHRGDKLGFHGWSVIEQRYDLEVGWRVLIKVRSCRMITFWVFDAISSLAVPGSVSEERVDIVRDGLAEDMIGRLNDVNVVSWDSPVAPTSAIEAARMYITHRDKCIQEIPPSSVGSRGHSIALEHAFFVRNSLQQQTLDAILLMDSCESAVTIKSYEKFTKITAGWKEFVDMNVLNANDVLVFEYIGRARRLCGNLKDLFLVSDFRVDDF